MGWYSKLLPSRLQAKTAVPAPVSAVGNPIFGLLQMSPAAITPFNAWLLYQNVAPLAKIVDLIADGVASLVPVVQIDGKPVDGHPVSNFLAKPGFNRTRKRFIKELTVQALVTGTGYVHVYGNPMMPPLALDVIKSQFISHFPGADNWPTTYLYSEGTRSVRFSRDDNPRDPHYVDDMQLGELVSVYDSEGTIRGIGLPRLQAIRSDVELRLKGITHNTALLDKGARLSGVLAFKSSLDPDQRNDIASQLRSQISGATNAGSILVTDGGEYEFQQMMQSARDMDFVKLMEIVEDAIASRFNVPVTLFRTSAQTNNNYETAWNILYDQAILPTFEMIYSSLARVFSERLGQEIEIVHDALTAPILRRQAVKTATELFTAKLLSRNEARQTIGYEPVLGGDKIYGPMGEIPVAEDFFTGLEDEGAAADFEARRNEAIQLQRGKPDPEEKPKPKPKPKDDKKSLEAFATLSRFLDSVKDIHRQVVH